MFFSNLGPKNFDGKTWLPLLIHILFRARKFVKHKIVPPPLDVFRYCETKRFPRKIAKHPYFAQNFFGCPKFFESLEASPQIFWHCETETNDRIVILLLSKKFWNKNNSETQTGSPAMILGDVRQKKIDKIAKLLLSKDFWYQNISETQEGAPTMFFGNLGQKNFDGKTWHPPF